MEPQERELWVLAIDGENDKLKVEVKKRIEAFHLQYAQMSKIMGEEVNPIDMLKQVVQMLESQMD